MTMEDEELFRLEEVRYVYPGNIVALDGVSLRVRRGAHVAILGANGSGKSTLLKVMDGLYLPQEGTLYAFGRPVTSRALEDERFASELHRRVGLLFQDPDVQLFSATVWDELAFGPLQLGWPMEQVQERVEEMLRWLALEEVRERPPYRLSGGEKRKVALGAVLVTEPEVLLLDEPTAFLDPRSRCQLLDYLLEWGERGTLVLCTHDLELAEEIANQIYVLDRGRVIAGGRPAEILDDETLLEHANLIHAHRHRHGDLLHRHRHDHRHHTH
ncbi:MAG: energy-coupling factor ABC transporter ATP-binding protein [Chloroflexia bacterium]